MFLDRYIFFFREIIDVVRNELFSYIWKMLTEGCKYSLKYILT